jgi:hypothetical protein
MRAFLRLHITTRYPLIINAYTTIKPKMITTIVLIIIWFTISCYRIYKEDKDFNPFNGSILDYFGWIFGAYTIALLLLYLLLKYAP